MSSLYATGTRRVGTLTTTHKVEGSTYDDLTTTHVKLNQGITLADDSTLAHRTTYTVEIDAIGLEDAVKVEGSEYAHTLTVNAGYLDDLIAALQRAKTAIGEDTVCPHTSPRIETTVTTTWVDDADDVVDAEVVDLNTPPF